MEYTTLEPSKPVRHWRGAIGDLALVGASVALVTWLLSSDDPLWLRLNPSPLIIVPLLIGGRYGLLAGIGSGLLTAAVSVVTAMGFSPVSWQLLVHEQRYLLAALPVLGLVAGELRSALMRTANEASCALDGLRGANLRTGAALRVAEESVQRLERQLAVHGLETISLENELTNVLKARGDAMYREVLNVLYRIAGVHEAAIYVPGDGSGALRRVALLEQGTELPEHLAAETPIVKRALGTRDLVTCRDVWKATAEQTGDWIAALPWVDHGGNVKALLMVRRMALLAINWQTFDRMKTVCQWVTCCRLTSAGAAHALSDAETGLFRPGWDEEVQSLRKPVDDHFDRLRKTACLCVRGKKLHQLPTVGMCFTGAGALVEEGGTVPEALCECLRPQDVCAPDPDSDRLMVLMPMMESRDAEPVAGRILDVLKACAGERSGIQRIECHSLVLQAAESAEAFLERLRRAGRQ